MVRPVEVQAIVRHPLRSARRAVARARSEQTLAAQVGDATLHVDPRDDHVGRSLYVRRVYEPALTQAFCHIVGRGDVVVDVGANIGYYAVLAASRVGPAGQVIAFEPAPRNFDLLRTNLAANGLTDVWAVEAAASDRDGSTELVLARSNLGGHRLDETAVAVLDTADRDTRERVTVPTVRLDGFLERHGVRPSVIKIDVEGAEPLVVSGLGTLLDDGRDLDILLEFTPGVLRRTGTDPVAWLEALVERGFHIHLVPKGPGMVHLASPRQVVEVFCADHAHADLVLSRDQDLFTGFAADPAGNAAELGPGARAMASASRRQVAAG